MKLRRAISVVLSMLLLTAALPGGLFRAEATYDMPYYIVVDISNQIVTVYDTATGDVARQMICSTGKFHYTPTGNFILPKNRKSADRKPWYYIPMFHRYVRYATRIQGEILFHSLPYTRRSLQSLDSQAASELGLPTSHGCIRLRWQDAEFIARNCLAGTAVQIMESGQRDDGLRELLYQQSYDAAGGLSYDSFLGISTEEGALGRFSEGKEVLDLQYRLRDLGLYNGKLDGVYDSATINAVRMAQYLLGGEISGIANRDFLQRVYQADAPTARNVPLMQGMSGPAVRALQDDLATLRLYGDTPDSVYDVAVVDAVKQFQRAYGYDEDGVAAPRVQKAIAYEAARVAETFEGMDYTGQWVGEPLAMARVKAREGAKLRKDASQQAKQIKKLSEGRMMIVLEQGEGWTRVLVGTDEGYIRNDLLAFGEHDLAVLKYNAEGSDLVYIVGNAADDYYAGARLPCEVFDDYLAANDQQVDIDSLVNYVTVDTGGEGAPLNLRMSPDSDSAVLDTVEEGRSLKVQRRYNEWTQVSYRGQSGYLMNRYLNFWTGPGDALDEPEDEEDEEPGMTARAMVKSATGKEAAVYDENADDAQVLGHLSDGTLLEVLDMWDGWCRIRCNGHEGYMLGEDLRVEVTSDEPEETEAPLLVEELRP